MKKTLLLFLLTIIVISCSRKRNNFVSRNFHAVTAEYNTLYNGDLALTEGQVALEDSYLDNYWEILPIERLEQQDFMDLPGEGENPNFERAEEKAIKAIQKHSMVIDGKERNPQIDEAYMLLGKSRYYSSRFLRAIEAFNFILATYPASNNIAQAKIWKAKTNIRLSNEQVAIRRLNDLLKYETQLSDQDYADASSMLAQAYLNLEELDSAAVYMQKAVSLTRKVEERGRYYFILGQLNDRLSQPQIANAYYDSVIDLNRKIPRRYMINAYTAKARNFDYENGDRLFLFEQLTDLAENRENRPYLDMIYNQFAEYYLKEGIEDSAINYYNYSLRQGSRDKYLVSRNYLNLAEIAFENTQYSLAAAYYDSTLTTTNEKTREYRSISKKRDNLDDVILYEQIANTNDSILKLVNFTEEERESYFQKYIDSLIARDEALREQQQKGNVRNNEFFTENPINRNTGGAFYFYNAAAVAQGKLAFESRWGNRELTDDWRVSSVASGGIGALDDDMDLLLEEGEGEIVYRIQDYLERIPTDPGVIDTLNLERNDAYFQLGVIYKEKFREYELAASKLETLLENDPQDHLILPTKYNLYQIYDALGNSANAEMYKEAILKNHPESRYAQILRNPDMKLAALADSPEVVFDTLTKALRRQEFSRVIEGTNKFINENTGEKLVPKFELLRAAALGRYYGFEAYKQSLNEIALTYPNADEGKEAQRLIDETLPQLEDAEFKPTDVKDNWKLFYMFPEPVVDFDLAKSTLDLGLEEYGYSGYSGSQDVYGPDMKLLVVHGFRSQGEALAFAKKLRTDKELDWEYEANTITSRNYRTLQIHKNLQSFLENYSN